MKHLSSSVASLTFAISFLCSVPVVDANEVAFIQIVGPDEIVNIERSGLPTVQATRYGPINKSETLWRIASANLPSRGVTVYQMLIAIFEKNPQAFHNNDINSLIDGSYLDLPSIAETKRYTHQEAVLKFSSLLEGNKATGSKPKTTGPAQQTPAKNDEAVESAPVVSESKPDSGIIAASLQALDELRDKLEKRIDELTLFKQKEMDVFREQLDETSQEVVGLAEVNHRMKIRMQELSDEMAAIREDLSITQRNQAQLMTLLDEPGSEESGGEGGGFFSSPLNLVLITVIPLLLIAAVGVLLWRRRAKRALQAQEEELAASTVSLMEEGDDQFSQLFSEDNMDDQSESFVDDEQFRMEEPPAAEPDLTLGDGDAGPADVDLSLATEADDGPNLDPQQQAADDNFAAIDLNEEEMSALAAFEDHDDESEDLVPSFSLDDNDSDVADDVYSSDLDSQWAEATESGQQGTASEDIGGGKIDLSGLDNIELDASSQDKPGFALDDEDSFEQALRQQQAQMESDKNQIESSEIDFSNIDLSDDDLSLDLESGDVGVEVKAKADEALGGSLLSDDMMEELLSSDSFNEDGIHPGDIPQRGAVDESDSIDFDSLLDGDADVEADADDGADLASKLDLARAYIEIHDKDGARKIIQEVLDSGSEKYKEQAEGLMARLS